MTERHLERRYNVLENLTGNKRNDYSINLDSSFITVRNEKTEDGIYTDSLRSAKRWIRKDIAREV